MPHYCMPHYFCPLYLCFKIYLALCRKTLILCLCFTVHILHLHKGCVPHQVFSALDLFPVKFSCRTLNTNVLNIIYLCSSHYCHLIFEGNLGENYVVHRTGTFFKGVLYIAGNYLWRTASDYLFMPYKQGNLELFLEFNPWWWERFLKQVSSPYDWEHCFKTLLSEFQILGGWRMAFPCYS